MLAALGVARVGAWDTSAPWIPKKRRSSRLPRRRPGVFAGSEGKDFRILAAGTAQNIVGLGVFVVGTFAANILISRSFGGGDAGATALGIVTLGTQFAFIAAAGTRFGMDMASVRYVSIEVGAGASGRVRVGRRAVGADRRLAVSVVVGALTVALCRADRGALSRRTPRRSADGRVDPGGGGRDPVRRRSPTCGSAAAAG